MRSVDLNSDLGEGCGSDAAMLQIVTSANIACGGHAGDAQTMRTTISLAIDRGIVIGAHPSYPDKEGFGRRRMNCTSAEIRDFVARQTAELIVHAESLGGRVAYVKPHGALGNDAAARRDIAHALLDGLRATGDTLAVLAISGTHLEQAARERGIPAFSEVYADRGYTSDGLLVPRSEHGALIEDVEQAVARMLGYIQTGSMATVAGSAIPLAGASICVHGDNEHAVEMAYSIRKMLASAGVRVQAFLADEPPPLGAIVRS
jgi:UPF0271 protein